MKEFNKLVELPAKGRAFIVTDIHGNLKDYLEYLKIWDESREKDDHFILTGDFIHSIYPEDGSLEIIKSVKERYGLENNFHALIGNHEWAQLTGTSVYKAGYNQNFQFLNLVEERYEDQADEMLHIYFDLFQKLGIAVRTKNKVLISHAGPSKHLKNEDDIKNIRDDQYSDNQVLYEMIWDRNQALSRNYLDPFLEKFGCKTSIVGHTPVNGVELNGNQLVVSSSFGMGKKAYVELDLKAKINNGRDLLPMIRYMDEDSFSFSIP